MTQTVELNLQIIKPLKLYYDAASDTWKTDKQQRYDLATANNKKTRKTKLTKSWNETLGRFVSSRESLNKVIEQVFVLLIIARYQTVSKN